MIFIAVATGSGTGCSVVVSQIFGSKRYAKMKTAISTAIISVLALSITLTLLGLILCSPILRIMNTPENIFRESALYLRIYTLSIVFIFIYNISSAIFTALGDSKTPLYFLAFSSILNVLLALLLVGIFKLGVAGAALATLIAQGVSGVLAISYLFHVLRKIKCDEKYRYFDKIMLLDISKIAIPTILQQSIISIGQLFIQSLINSFGTVVVAAYSAAIKINNFAIVSFVTMSGALSSYTAQNIGAKRFDRVSSGCKTAYIINYLICSAFFIALFFFGKNLMGLFVDSTSNPDVISVGVQMTMIQCPFFFVFASKITTDGILRGAGTMKIYMAGTLLDLIIRVGASYILAGWFGAVGIWWAFPVGWICSTAVSNIYYFSGRWKKELHDSIITS